MTSVAPVTPRALDVYAVTTGGTAMAAMTGPANGFTLKNPTGATEPLFYSLIGEATTAETDGVIELAAGASVTFADQIADGVALSVNAATDGHAFAGYRWQVSGIDLKRGDYEDALYEAGCDDALIAVIDDDIYLDFDRAAASFDDAVKSARGDVERAGGRVVNVMSTPE